MPINALIALVGALVPVINQAVGFINRTIETLKQNKEMTEDQWIELKAHVESVDSIGTHWMTDEEKAATGAR